MEDEKFEEMMDELRLKEKSVVLTNQRIIELAYVTKERIQNLSGQQMEFEHFNCYNACFYTVQRLLKNVDLEYLEWHPAIAEFFHEGRELEEHDWDSLHREV